MNFPFIFPLDCCDSLFSRSLINRKPSSAASALVVVIFDHVEVSDTSNLCFFWCFKTGLKPTFSYSREVWMSLLNSPFLRSFQAILWRFEQIFISSRSCREISHSLHGRLKIVCAMGPYRFFKLRFLYRVFKHHVNITCQNNLFRFLNNKVEFRTVS